MYMDRKPTIKTYCLKVYTTQTKMLDEVVSFLENKKDLLGRLDVFFEFTRSENFVCVFTERAYLFENLITYECWLNRGHSWELNAVTYTVFENQDLYDLSLLEIKNSACDITSTQ